jgi:hypothetical protein
MITPAQIKKIQQLLETMEMSDARPLDADYPSDLSGAEKVEPEPVS